MNCTNPYAQESEPAKPGSQQRPCSASLVDNMIKLYVCVMLLPVFMVTADHWEQKYGEWLWLKLGIRL